MDKNTKRQYSFMVPEDWDEPSPGHEALCARFLKAVYEQNGVRLPYRFFEPASFTGRVPVVLFLHGADTVGEDNEIQIGYHDVATVFAEDAWQKREPCYIIAPQYKRSMHWSSPEVAACLHSLLRFFLGARKGADPDRVYLYGYSAGGVGVFEQLKRFPDTYAAAVPICGATSGKELEALAKTPVWMLHAADDRIVRASYHAEEKGWIMHLGSRDLYERLKDTPGWDFHYTEYPEGFLEKEYGLNPHCSWVCFEKDGEVKTWMFAQRL